MNTIKHLFTALLLLCATVATAHDFEVDGIYYDILSEEDKTVAVTYRGSYYNSYDNEYTGSVVIPESVTYNGTTYSVTSIGEIAFRGCTGLTSIEIPNSVTSIGNGAFQNCSSLNELRIEDGNNNLSLGYNVLYEGEGLFYDCPLETLYLGRDLSYNTDYDYGYSPFFNKTTLTSVTIGNSVTSIGESAFLWCSGLTSITIPNNVKSIGDDAFRGCSGLASITIPNSVTSIGDDAFSGCSGLASITIPNSVTSIGNRAFEGCTGLTSVTIPNSVTSIGNYAFSDCSGLTSITIPNSVTSIGYDAFAYCTGLTSITIPNSVTSIGDYAFNGCSGLTSIVVDGNNTKYDSREDCNAIIETETNTLVSGCKNTVIPSSVTSIGESAFSGCKGLTSIEIPNSVTSIGKNAFSGTAWYNNQPDGVVYAGKVLYEYKGRMPSNTSIIIKDGTLGIADKAFYYCTGLTSITIPNSVTRIGNYAFVYCTRLTSVVIGNSVTSIGESAFSWCTGLTSIEIPNSVTSIGSYAFEYCSELTSIVIGNGVTSIGVDAFRDCTGITSIEIGNSVTSIKDYAFRGCTGLKTVFNFSNLTFRKGSNSYGHVAYYADKVYNAPNGSKEGDFIFGKPNDVNTLLYYLGNATELTLPANYKGGNYTIGANVFKGNTTITSITIPNSITSIGDDAFYNCSGLTSITIPNSVTSIGNYALYGCTGLTSITIPNSVTSIEYAAFYYCTGLEKVCINDLAAWCNISFGSSIANPLYYAKNLYLNGALLTELSIPAETAEVKDYAFYNCRGVTNIDIVDGVKSIGNSAFYGCCDLETLYISNTIESIGDYAFAECNNILDIKIGSKKVITASENIFSTDVYNNAYLYVPDGRKDFYAKTSPWSNFIIREMDFTGIDEVFNEVKGENGKVKTIYDLNGRAVEKPAKGIYIINGKKVLIK